MQRSTERRLIYTPAVDFLISNTLAVTTKGIPHILISGFLLEEGIFPPLKYLVRPLEFQLSLKF